MYMKQKFHLAYHTLDPMSDKYSLFNSLTTQKIKVASEQTDSTVTIIAKALIFPAKEISLDSSS